MHTTRLTLAIALMAAMLATVGCSGFAKLTPQNKLLVTCDDALTQYEMLYSQSIAITSDVTVSHDARKYVITVINPKLNKAKGLIIRYCQSATGDSSQVTAALAEVVNLFIRVPK